MGSGVNFTWAGGRDRGDKGGAGGLIIRLGWDGTDKTLPTGKDGAAVAAGGDSWGRAVGLNAWPNVVEK